MKNRPALRDAFDLMLSKKYILFSVSGLVLTVVLLLAGSIKDLSKEGNSPWLASVNKSSSVDNYTKGKKIIDSAKPNFIFILTDDLDRSSFNKKTMPNTIRYIRKQGTTFKHQIYPMATCCPSRAVFLSGQYNHNNEVLQNNIKHGGFPSYYRKAPGISHGYNIASFMKRGGYKTAIMGKYLNAYGNGYRRGAPGTGPEPVKGWDKWFVTIQNQSTKYYNYKIKFNGSVENFRTGISLKNPKARNSFLELDPINKVAYYNAPQCNSPDGCSLEMRRMQSTMYSENVYTNQAIDFLRQQDKSPNKQDQKPAFIWYSSDTPHGTTGDAIYNHRLTGGAGYLPKFMNAFSNHNSKSKIAYNEKNVTDKPRYIRALKRFSLKEKAKIRGMEISRYRSLKSLDFELNKLYKYLNKTGKDRNTILVFTSDNGYMTGQHRLPKNKFVPYKEVIDFPIIYKGPGIAKKRVIKDITGNIDFVPTILSLANTKQRKVVKDPKSGNRRPFDGISLKPYMMKNSHKTHIKNRSTILLESVVGRLKIPFQPYKGVINNRYSLIKYRNFGYNIFKCKEAARRCGNHENELYDLKKDPNQLVNLVRKYKLDKKLYRAHDDGTLVDWREGYDRNHYEMQTTRAFKRNKLLRVYKSMHRKLKKLEFCEGKECRD